MDMTLGHMSRNGMLRVGFNLNNLAIIRRDGEQLAGPALDAAKAVCDAAGLQMEPVFFANARELSEAAGTEWDIGFLAADPSRSARIAFSEPYYHVEATFLVRNSIKEDRCSDILENGHSILSAQGAAFHSSLSALAAPGSLIASSSPAAALEHFLAREADILAGIRETLERIKAPDCRVLSDSFCRLGQAIGVCVHQSGSLPFINQVLKRL